LFWCLTTISTICQLYVAVEMQQWNENKFQNPMEKMVERCKIDTSNTTMHDCLFSWLVIWKMDLLSQQIYNAIIQYNAIKYI
jgi:hypothetical protein